MTEPYPTLRAVVLDALDARRLGEFWREFLGFVYGPGDEPPPDGEADTRGMSWLVLLDQAGYPRLAIQQVDELPSPTWPDPTVPQQMHLDVTVATMGELDLQHRRALELGATVLEDRSESAEEALIVLADPAGHPFCLLVNGWQHPDEAEVKARS